MSRNSSVVLGLVLLSLISIASVAQVAPSADAYVTSSMPTANFGASPILPVQAETTSYVRFNLGALPGSAKIAKATLRLYVDAVTAPGSFDVFQVSSGWSEPGVTFNTAPSLGASATGGQSIAIAKTSVNQFVLVDVTPLVQGWLDGSVPNYGLALALTTASGSFAFDSKENSGHYPEVEVVLDGTAALGATTSVGTVGASGAPVSKALGLTPNLPSDPYVNNGTVLQTGTSFNIDGSGTAATFNATSQYLLNGAPVLGSTGSSSNLSLFLGPAAGLNNAGAWNLFLGANAGQLNGSGNFNTFTGALAGQNNSTGSYLTFMGMQSGRYNTSGQANSFFGTNSGYRNNTGNYNTFIGTSSGFSNTTGDINTFVGAQSGEGNIAGRSNSFLGTNSGFNNVSGNSNTFIGMSAGLAVVTGSQNTFLGFNAGVNANPAGNSNIYVSNLGASGDNGTIRIGDPSNQTTAYIAGINGVATSSGVPVFIDSTGKLGTMGGGVNFSQLTGTLGNAQLGGTYGNAVTLNNASGSFAGTFTGNGAGLTGLQFSQLAGNLASSQFNGAYSNSVTLSNASNVFNGTFVGNGSGLTGVPSGLLWPVVQKTIDYTVLTSDFSSASGPGNFVILTGLVTHRFTLPNPAPPNGSCVAIGDFAGAGINSGTNVYLSISPNGLTLDGSSGNGTQVRHQAFLYCSDGTGYWRLGREQTTPSQIGPWLYTLDTGTVNVLTTTYVNGLAGGLGPSVGIGNMIYLLPKFANTSSNPTLNVNGLGAIPIKKFGTQLLVPGDLSTTALAHMIFDGAAWQLFNPQSNQGTVTSVTATAPLTSTGGPTPVLSCPTCVTNPVLNGATGSIGGDPLTAGNCTTGTATVTGAAVGHPVSVSASDGSLPNGLIILSAAVTSSDTVTVQLCAVASVTPAANTYNVATQ